MPFELNPDPKTLGITAPYLGRWFTDNSQVTLPVPQATDALGLPVDLENNDWRPPATGFLSLFIANAAAPPKPLNLLRDAKGKHPFQDGEVIALFTLLPEVRARLRELSRNIPPLTGGTQTSPAANPTRLTVGSFALVLPSANNDITKLLALVPNAPSSFPDEFAKARYLGFEPSTGTSVRNGDRPMTQLLRPGAFGLSGGVVSVDFADDIILTGLPTGTKLWAFDARGRAIDPGAVAAWFSYLIQQSTLNGAENALAFGDTTDWAQDANGKPLVANVTAGRVVHLVDAHEGVLADPFVGASGRLRMDGSSVTDTVLVASTNGTAFTFSDPPPAGSVPYNPAVDNAPEKRMALLPDGAYATTTLTLWPNGAVATGLERDFARIAAVDIERHLVGLARGDSASVPTDPDARRSADQNRPSTRTKVAVCTVPDAEDVLIATAEPVAGAIVDGLSQGTSARVVVGVADAQGGALTSPLAAALPDIPGKLPGVLVETTNADPEAGTYKVRPLVGGQDAATPTQPAPNQQVLLEVKLAPEVAGAWVRAWPLGFDFDRAEHFRMDGGGGLIASDGTARLVMQLADRVTVGIDPSALPSFDLVIIGRDTGGVLRRRTYGDCRYHRPDPVAGSLVQTIDGTMTWFVCETGESGTGAPTAKVVPGATLLIKQADGSFTLAARSKIPTAALAANTLTRALGTGDVITLTQPTFKATTDRIDDRGLSRSSDTDGGSLPGGLVAPGVTGVVVDRTSRFGRGGSRPRPSMPYATQDRFEVVASWEQGGDSHAVVGAAPLLSRSHELLPHDAGHPGSAAGVETHGTGVRLQGPAAALAAEYVIDRTAGLVDTVPSALQQTMGDIWVRSEPALAIEAALHVPPALAPTTTTPRRWAAVLKTNAVGMEGLPLAGSLAYHPPGGATPLYPLSAVTNQFVTWLNGLNNIPNVNNLGTQVKNIIDSNVGNTDQAVRALDRRIKTAAEGVREVAFSLKDAFRRAQDLIYIETPAIGDRGHGPTGDRLALFDFLKQQLTEKPWLHLVVAVAAQMPPGLPKALIAVRDDEMFTLLDGLRKDPALENRVAYFAPGAGAGRSLRLASTSVIVDDVFALTGTTHLWRRGLTFDSSLAAAVFDERLVDGRPQEIRRFRRALLAGRIGISETLVPDEPAELVRSIIDFDRTGSFRLASHAIRSPDRLSPGVPYPTDSDRDVWNVDGTIADLSFADVVAFFLRATASTSPDGTVNDPLAP
ncbi:MAG TPA: hypothetical protein VIF57_08950 [Polyangia bacterium]|jgi:hypothetical protein